MFLNHTLQSSVPLSPYRWLCTLCSCTRHFPMKNWCSWVPFKAIFFSQVWANFGLCPDVSGFWILRFLQFHGLRGIGVLLRVAYGWGFWCRGIVSRIKAVESSYHSVGFRHWFLVDGSGVVCSSWYLAEFHKLLMEGWELISPDNVSLVAMWYWLALPFFIFWVLQPSVECSPYGDCTLWVLILLSTPSLVFLEH